MNNLGIDIGGTRIKLGIVDFYGNILKFKELKTPRNLTDFEEALLNAVREILSDIEKPSSVGVGCKGIVHSSTTKVEIVPGTFKFLEGVVLKNLISPELPANTTIFADNDARAALAGEVVWGAANGLNNVIMLTLGTGVGGGIVADGRILRGKAGIAGHLGHITVDPNGPLCICGNYGCLETFFSASAIEAEALSGIHRGCESILTDRHKTSFDNISCQIVLAAAHDGDKFASSIIQKAIRYLSAAIAGLSHVFDPDIIILGGQISDAGELLFNPLREEVWSRSKRLLGRDVPIVRQQVNDSSGVIGAAALSIISNQ